MLDYFTQLKSSIRAPLPGTRPLTLDPVKLLWLHQSLPPFSRLSLNVIRETSNYLQSTALLISITRSGLLIRHVLSRDRLHVPIQQELDLSGKWVLVSIPYEQVLILASGDGMQGQAVSLQGRVEALPTLLYYHHSPGAIYVSYKHCVYLFGGNTPSCETFKLHRWAWLTLPNMTAPRVYFAPCLHRSFIYLCGGFCPSLDIFCPDTDTFLPSLSLSLPEFSSETLALSINNWILIISENCTCCYHPETNKLETASRGGLCPWSLPKSYVVVGTWLYFEVPGDGIASGDVMTGEYRRLKGC